MAEPTDPNGAATAPFDLGGGGASSLLRGVQPQAPAAAAPQQPQTQEQMLRDAQTRLVQKMLGLTEALPGALQADLAARHKAALAAAGAGYQKDAMARQVANAPLPPVYTPQRAPQPTPPRFSRSDPMNAVVSPLALIAAIGGLFARRAGTATIKAMTSAMEGLKERDQKKYENALKEFDQQFKATQEYNRLEHEQYQEAWDNRKRTWDERVARMQMLSTQYGNTAMTHALNTGNAELIQAQLSAMTGALSAIDKIKMGPNAGHAMDTQKSQAVDQRTKELVSGGMSEGEARTKAIREQSPSLTLDQRKELQSQKHDLTMEEIAERAKQKVAAAGGKPGGLDISTMNKANAADVRMRLEKIQKDHPEMPQEDAYIRAMNEHNASKTGTSESKLPLSVQGEITKGWAGTPAAEAWETGFYKLDLANQRKLGRAAETLRYADDVADFFRVHPRAAGALAALSNTMRLDSLTSTQLDQFAKTQGSPEDVQAAQKLAADRIAQVEGGVGKIVGAYLPTGEKITFSDASDAITGFKMLMQLGLNDAASLSTNGQGGTVWLDRRFTGDIFNPNTTPESLLRLIAIRQEESNNIWKNANPAAPLDWHQRKDLDKVPFFKGNYVDKMRTVQPNAHYLEGVRYNRYNNLHGQALDKVIKTAPGMSDAIKMALLIRDTIPSEERLDAWLKEQENLHTNGQMDDKDFQLLQQAARIVRENTFGGQ